MLYETGVIEERYAGLNKRFSAICQDKILFTTDKLAKIQKSKLHLQSARTKKLP